MSNPRQDELLDVVSRGGGEVDLLYDLWTIANKAPARCAEILLQYRDVSRAIKSAVLDLKEARDQLARVKDAAPEIQEVSRLVLEFNGQMAKIDEDTVLNRINRLCDVADRIRQLRASGALETLRALLAQPDHVRR